MCGIFALLNNDNHFTQEFIDNQFKKGSKRGPEFSILKNVMIKAIFGFHRLAINGLNKKSNQPLYDNEKEEIILICNGEIYNYKELYSLMGIIPNTDSDCEVILHLYKKYGIEQTLQLLDGVFSFVLIDARLQEATSKMYVARDPYGVRPLYILNHKNIHTDIKPIIAFASELKVLSEFYQNLKNKDEYMLSQFQPGSYSEYELLPKAIASWRVNKENTYYHSTGFHSTIFDNSQLEYSNIYYNIQYYFKLLVNS
jgi:asparagine synthase (glutamine-hydrolysing)